MAKTAAEIIKAWEARWPVGARPYLEAIAAAADVCDSKVGKEKMGCYAEATARKKVETKKSVEAMIAKALGK